MSTTKEDGGPAFPSADTHSNHSDDPPFEQTSITSDVNEGMTLRDYFAAKAMQGVLSNSYVAEMLGKMKELLPTKEIQNAFDTEVMPKVLAQSAYAHADAMIVERGKKCSA